MISNLCDVDGSTVAVIESDTVKDLGSFHNVLSHVFPQIRTVLRRLAVAQLHAVPPRDELTTQVDVRA